MTLEQIEKIANSFKIRSSATIEIMGRMGLTEKQEAALATLEKRKSDPTAKPLTKNMERDLADLLAKKANPELPEGAKTHCKKWLKQRLFHRRGEVKSKYIAKGNIHEEDGFTLMTLQLGLGMVYKNTKLYENEYLIGTPDLIVRPRVLDNKCSWDLDTFPMYETEIPDEKYEWQINSYCELTDCEDGDLCYTLIDADEQFIQQAIRWAVTDNEKYDIVNRMVFTKDYFERLKAEYFPDAEYDYFVEIPEADRLARFEVKKDPAKIADIYKRVPMCRQFIKELLIKKYHGK